MRFTAFGWTVVIYRKHAVAVPVDWPKQPVQPKKVKKPKRQFCFYKDKTMYTREAAVEAASIIKKSNPQIRIYCCEFCNTWHLTHRKAYRTY